MKFAKTINRTNGTSPWGWSLFLCSFLGVILCLGVPEFVVLARFVCYQFGVGTLLDDCAFVEHRYLVAELARGQTVTDIDCRFVAGDVIELTGLL